MQWVGSYINTRHLISEEESSLNNMKAYNVEKVGLAIIKFLDSPNENSFEQFSNKIFNLFKLFRRQQLKIGSISKLFQLMPKSSADSFNHFFYQYPIFSLGSLFASGALIVTLTLKIFTMLPEEAVFYLVIPGLFLYGPSLAEKGYTFILKCINSEDGDFNNPKIAEIRSKYKNLLMFSDKDSKSMRVVSPSFTFGKQ